MNLEGIHNHPTHLYLPLIDHLLRIPDVPQEQVDLPRDSCDVANSCLNLEGRSCSILRYCNCHAYSGHKLS